MRHFLLFLSFLVYHAICQKNDSELIEAMLQLDTNSTGIVADYEDNNSTFSGSDELTIEGSGIEEGSGEKFVEQFRFVIPVRKRRDVDPDETVSVEVIQDGSGLEYEETSETIRQKRDEGSDDTSKSSSENISIESLSRKKRDDSLQKIDARAAKIILDVAELTRDDDLLNLTLSQLQKTGNVTVFRMLGYGNATAAPCKNNTTCYSDSDCNHGKCQGNYVGTCNCNACLNFWQCWSDDDCGGFVSACNMSTHMCDCFGAFLQHGMSDKLSILANWCNAQLCNSTTASNNCFGLPCNAGHCSCH